MFVSLMINGRRSPNPTTEQRSDSNAPCKYLPKPSSQRIRNGRFLPLSSLSALGVQTSRVKINSTVTLGFP